MKRLRIAAIISLLHYISVMRITIRIEVPSCRSCLHDQRHDQGWPIQVRHSYASSSQSKMSDPCLYLNASHSIRKQRSWVGVESSVCTSNEDYQPDARVFKMSPTIRLYHGSVWPRLRCIVIHTRIVQELRRKSESIPYQRTPVIVACTIVHPEKCQNLLLVDLHRFSLPYRPLHQ
jgi:hypothetical protein